MSRIRIEVGSGTLDLFEGTDDLFYVTKQINDLSNLQNRQADFTRQIKIPGTKNNLSVLNLLSNERIGNPSYNANVLLDDILIIPFGNLLIIDSTKYSINIIIFSGNYGLFDAIPNNSIKTINTGALDFEWDIPTIQSRSSATDGPVSLNASFLEEQDFIDNDQSNRYKFDHDIKTFGFYFYMKTLFEMVINEAGYTLDDSDINTDYNYNNLVFACPVTAFIDQTTVTTYFAEWKRATNQIILGGDGVTRIQFNSQIQDTDALWSNTLWEYDVPENGEFIIEWRYNIDFEGLTNAPLCQLEIVHEGGTIDNISFSLDGNYSGILTATFTAVTGDKVWATGWCNSSGSKEDILTFFPANNFIFKDIGSQTVGNLILTEYFPDVNRRDYIKSFAMLLNCFIDSNPFNKLVKLVPFNDLYSATAQDLTKNLDISNDIITQAGMDGYYRSSNMVYNNDSELKRTDTDYSVSFLNDQALPLYGNIINVIYAGSDKTQLLNAVGPTLFNTIKTPFYKADFKDYTGLTTTIATDSFGFSASESIPDFAPGDYLHTDNGTYRITQKTNSYAGKIFNTFNATLSNTDYKIIKISLNNLNMRIGLRDFTGGITNSMELNDTGWGLAGATTQTFYNVLFDGLQMVNIYTTYYKNLFDALQTPNILNVWMNFNTSEFSQIDMLRPVFIDGNGFNGLYYINKIEQFKLNQPCRVELIRINALI